MFNRIVGQYLTFKVTKKKKLKKDKVYYHGNISSIKTLIFFFFKRKGYKATIRLRKWGKKKGPNGGRGSGTKLKAWNSVCFDVT